MTHYCTNPNGKQPAVCLHEGHTGYGKITDMFNLAPILEAANDKLIAISVFDLETGAETSINADEAFHPASTIKVHVMMEVFHQAEQVLFSLEDCLPITNSFTSIVDGNKFSLLQSDDGEQTLYPRVGETESIAELTRLMIVRSSNLATNILLEKVGTENVSDFIHALGIEGVSFIRGIDDSAAFLRGMNNSATARGLTQTMRLIAEKKVVSEAASEKMVEILLGQEFNESIPARLPAAVKVAHKTGWTGDVYHDTGIVYPEGRRPYALTIMTRGFAEDQPDQAHACMAEISKLIYEKFQ
jgi:beta-lactamase class A